MLEEMWKAGKQVIRNRILHGGKTVPFLTAVHVAGTHRRGWLERLTYQKLAQGQEVWGAMGPLG